MPTSDTRILLVRHGETPWNVAGRWQGFGDPGLTDAGREQASVLAAQLASDASSPWQRIVSSDLLRALETARILAEVLAVPIETDERLRELDVGTWTGLTREEIEARDARALENFERGEPTVRPGGGESRIEIRIRTRDCVCDLTQRYPGGRIIVVTHLGAIRALVPGAEPSNASTILVRGEQIAARPIDRGTRPGEGPL